MTAEEIRTKIKDRWRIHAEDPEERSEVFDFLEELGFSSKAVVGAMGGNTYPSHTYVGSRYSDEHELWIYQKDDSVMDGPVLEYSEIVGTTQPIDIPEGEAFTAALDALLF